MDDISNDDQVSQLQKQLLQKDNDVATMMAQINAITAQLKAEDKIFRAIACTSRQIACALTILNTTYW